MPNRTTRMAAIMKEDQENDPDCYLNHDDEDDEDEDEDEDDYLDGDNNEDDKENDLDYDLTTTKTKTKMTSNSRTSLYVLWIRLIDKLVAFIDALTTNQVSRMLRDMSIAVLRELRGFSIDNDNINPGWRNNAQETTRNSGNNKGQP
ncbi:hypothetical protein Patl1_14779 [Pistacia atlantica]|uniref:Uncharacterized protein n=1 Tax=Pistacia atlantica TaxID=434234 RepID=A0ACC1AXP2_9ROSI|nr:hypothetical protein Patl1_14779 [Pistacia atlantica]